MEDVNEEEKINENKSNKKMMILSFFGILFVVLGHTGQGSYLFGNIFPYYSFHMPLFIFISGYFYKKQNEDNLGKYIWTQFKKLVIPYFIWNIIYGLILLVIKNFDLVSWGREFNLYSLFIRPWIDGHQFVLNLAAWFILALFLVKIAYACIRKITSKLKIYNDYIYLILFLIISVVAIKYRNNANDYMLTLLRTSFFLFFYQFGIVYRKLENKIKINVFIKLCVIVLVQLIVFKIDSSSVSHIIVFMDFKSKYAITAIITALTGIMFWVNVSTILEPALKDSKIVNYISNHTKEIMFHHIFWIFIINTIIKFLGGLLELSSFNDSMYRNTIFYYYTAGVSQTPIIYAFLAICIPLVLHYIYEKKLVKLKKKYIKWKQRECF